MQNSRAPSTAKCKMSRNCTKYSLHSRFERGFSAKKNFSVWSISEVGDLIIFGVTIRSSPMRKIDVQSETKSSDNQSDQPGSYNSASN
mmetsp:Transcript_13257/g.27836  ORF Transcript_13257/g.27836 Transcript_13257/m.27836 type:complete len:88 (+) Transcript_13257:47-310(+)